MENISNARPPPIRSSLFHANQRDYQPVSNYDVPWYPEERTRPSIEPTKSAAQFGNAAVNQSNWSPQFYHSRNHSINSVPNAVHQSQGTSVTGAPAVAPLPTPPQPLFSPNLPIILPTTSPIPLTSQTPPQQSLNAQLSSNTNEEQNNRPASAGPSIAASRPICLNPNHINRNQSTSRCPFILSDRTRRLSSSNQFTNMVHQHYPYPLQSSSYPYHHIRPAYAPHENLWYRQQNNQEMHRRHFMNNNMATGDSNVANDSFSTNGNNRLNGVPGLQPNAVYCLSCDQQHGLPSNPNHRRMRPSVVCRINNEHYVSSSLRNPYTGR